MNKAETIALMKIIKGYYPMYYRNNESIQEVVTLWHKILQDDDFLHIQKGLERFVKTDSKGFPPVPGQIITLAKDVRIEELNARQRAEDLLPEPETKVAPMPDKVREFYKRLML